MLVATGRTAEVTFDGQRIGITPTRVGKIGGSRDISIPVSWLSGAVLKAPTRLMAGQLVLNLHQGQGYKKPNPVIFMPQQRAEFEALHAALNAPEVRDAATAKQAEWEALRPTAPVTSAAAPESPVVVVAGPQTTTYKERKKTSHTFHLLASVCTGGLWAPVVWAPVTAWHKAGPRKKITEKHHY